MALLYYMIIRCLVCRSPDISLSKWLDYWEASKSPFFFCTGVMVAAARHLFVKILRCGLDSRAYNRSQLLTSITLCSLRNWPIMICSKCFGSRSRKLGWEKPFIADNNKELEGEAFFLMTLLISGLQKTTKLD